MEKTIHEELSDAITSKEWDREYVTSLLKQGADPLGGMNEWGDTPIADLFASGFVDWDDPENGELSDRFPEIMELFIQNGFDCSRFQPYSEETEEHSEFYDLALSVSPGACKALKMMLDNGLEPCVLDAFLNHLYFDWEMVEELRYLIYGKDELIWGFRMIMLCASYPHILNDNDYLRASIEMDDTNKGNTYDLKKFRQYEDFDFEFDPSTRYPLHSLSKTTVTAIEKSTGKAVWKMHI